MSEQQAVIGISPRPDDRTDKRNFQYFEGISAESVGATAIALQRLVVPPGAAAPPHSHNGYETAIYVLSGRVETRWGEGLAKSLISGPGDYVFIPPGVPHSPKNLSDSEPAIAIIARSFPGEQEPVTPYDPDGLAPE